MSKTAAQLKQLLSLGENQTLEYLTSCDLKHCGPQVCAFLNTQGGYLLCGVDDNG
ncbi:helix-turn-helix domain-containing protein, partial [Salmonella enterica]|uniref:AlbA family DNA-binding domain-containing protein n=2 Tax=Gammaproteobacteria TaxID=1236 RepID=UPI003C6DD4DD